MKYSELLMQILEINNYWFLPKYPFRESLDEYIEIAYSTEDKEMIEKLENYCHFCLTNLDLLVKENWQ